MPGERYLEIAREGARLALRHGCLIVEREGLPEVSVAIFELGAVVLAHPRCVISQPAMAALMDSNVPLLVCDDTFLPSGLMLPLRANALSSQRMQVQAAAKLPLRKRLWQSIVRAKVRAQAAALTGLHQNDGGLGGLARLVTSGDPANIEARAAQRYWPLLFRDDQFRRRFEADDQNRLLNYGYAILRACTGRAIAAAGLHPTLGLHHKSRDNPYCLADDLMEPYRPLVDAEVAVMAGERGRDCPLDTPSKQRLLELLELRLRTSAPEATMRTVSECIGTTAVSLARIFEEEAEGNTNARASQRGTIVYPDGLFAW